LKAIAEFRILAGDAISQRMQVGFAGDDRTGCAKLFNQPGIVGGYSVQVAVEMHAATGGRTG
jgi:hypothetical protein